MLTDEKVDEMCRKLRVAFHSNNPEILINRMVTRFLLWRLPKDFYPDCYISFDREKAKQDPNNWPVGTNLLTAEQAREMIEHMLGDV